MIFQQILNEETGCLSYLIGCGRAGEAVVVDPGRDRVDDYLALARKKGLAVTHIVETHVHADHVSGNQASGRQDRGADSHPSRRRTPRSPTRRSRTATRCASDRLRLKVLHTPGHTPDSICLLVTDASRGDEPWFALTGDTLFVGDVGRPDFGGERAAARLYQSLTGRLLVLPDSVEVYPAHGAGLELRPGHVEQDGLYDRLRAPVQPGAPRRDVDELRPAAHDGPAAEAAELRAHHREEPGAGPADRRRSATRSRRRRCGRRWTRAPWRSTCASPEEFGAGHSPGAINVWIESPQFAARAGLFLPADTPMVLVAGGPTDLVRAAQGLGRIGVDDIAGYLQFGMTDWRSHGLPVATVPQITVHDLATMREERPDLVVVDVREPFEWDEGHIEGAVHLPMGEAVRRMAELPAERPKAVVCAGGFRSSTVISALSREGMTGWHNVSGGMTAWLKAGYASPRPAGREGA